MTTEPKCAECGTPLLSDAPRGLCPRCLMRRALDDSDTVTGASAAEVAQVAIENPARSMPLGTLRYFGDYELLDEIARGGMGVVYKARQSSLNRIVAVKMILSGHLASAADVKRFQTEAEAAANLRHPNIVAIHEVGDHDGQHYFSMDFIEGKNLAEVARGHPMPARRAAEIVKAIAEAIHYAHQRGTLHRDLKPHNVILGANDQPHITDFGLAKQIQRDSGLTREGSIMGSPSYMSPEQAAGKQEQVGPASDVYSLGAILYELLTGRPPFREENPAATLVAVLNDSATPPSKINPRVPADLETICGKCLEKRAERRYHSARELAEELDRFLNHEPILARPISRVRQMWNWLQKHPWVITGAGTMAILALVSLSHGLWQQKQFNDWKAANPGLVAPVEFEFFFATGPLGVVWFYAAIVLFLRFWNHARAYRTEGVPMPRRFMNRYAAFGVVQIIYGVATLLAGVRFHIWHRTSFDASQSSMGSAQFLIFSAIMIWAGVYAVWLALGFHDSSRFTQSVEGHLDWTRKITESRWQLQLAATTGARKQLIVAVGFGLLAIAAFFNALVRLDPVTHVDWWTASPRAYRIFSQVGLILTLLALGLFAWKSVRIVPRSIVSEKTLVAPKKKRSIAGGVTAFIVFLVLIVQTARSCVARWQVVQYYNQTVRQLDSSTNTALAVLRVPEAMNFAAADPIQRLRAGRAEATNLWSRIHAFVSKPQVQRAVTNSFRYGNAIDISHFNEAPAAGSTAGDATPQSAATRLIAMQSTLENEIIALRLARQRPFAQIDFKTGEWISEWQFRANSAQMEALAKLFCLRTAAHLHLGQSSEAIDHLLVIPRIAELAGSLPSLEATLTEASLLEYFLHGVWEGLARARWSEPELRQLQTVLASLDLIYDFDRHLRADFELSNFGLEIWSMVFTMIPLAPPDISKNQLRFMRMFAEDYRACYSVANPQVFPSRCRSIDRQVKALRESGGGLDIMFMHVMEKAGLRVARTQSYIHLASVACALERNRAAHQRFPDSLDQLVPTFCDRIPRDVIGGQPLHYRASGHDRASIHSVGWNAMDDGGARTDERDWVWLTRMDEP